MGPGPSDPADGGRPARDAFSSLRENLAGFLGARLALLGLEAKEAAGHGGKAAALFAVALFLLLPAYLLLCAAIALLLIDTAGLNPALALGSLSAIHIVAILILATLGRRSLSNPMFRASSEEFEKDKAWVQSIRTPDNTRTP
jgi:uncharacterized membrane protein YqjE